MLQIQTNAREWAKAAVVRAAKTMAQTALSMMTIGATMGEVDWKKLASVAVVAGVYSMLTSIVGLPEVEEKKEEENE
jgi:hypothetical protein